jgi:peroxiredoxin Q/BCP
VLGVSVDPVESHQQFATKFSFGFPLLSDTTEAICTAYGVNVKDGQYPERVTFIVDRDGKIARVFPKVSPREHAREVLAALDALAGRRPPSR